MEKTEMYNAIEKAVIDLDDGTALKLVDQVINEKYNLLEVIELGFGRAIRKIGDLWNEGEFFLPELMMGGKIVQQCVDKLLPNLQANETHKIPGKVVMATIEGDIHSIGKSIVATMLSASGFKVFDLGADVSVDKIISAAEENKVNVIGVSALLTTTMVGQKKLIEQLKARGIRDKYKVIFGGAPVSKDWVENCGGDGYAENAVEAVTLVKNILNV